MVLIPYIASAVLGFIGLSSSIPLEYVVYSEQDQLGESIRFTKTHRNISCAYNLIGGQGDTWSRCYIGQ